MDKLLNLYRLYINENRSVDEPTERYGQFMDFLQKALSNKDFIAAEEFFNDILAEVKENSFVAGAKYLYELHMELSDREPEE